VNISYGSLIVGIVLGVLAYHFAKGRVNA